MKPILLGSIAIAALTLTSCTKNVADAPAPPLPPDDSVTATVESLSGRYLTTAITVGDGGFVEKDITTEVMPDECQRDDTHELHTDGTVTYTDEGNQCSSTRPVLTGTWELANNIKITIDGEVHTIKSFNGRYLITQDQKSYNGKIRTITTFYQKL